MRSSGCAVPGSRRRRRSASSDSGSGQFLPKVFSLECVHEYWQVDLMYISTYIVLDLIVMYSFAHMFGPQPQGVCSHVTTGAMDTMCSSSIICGHGFISCEGVWGSGQQFSTEVANSGFALNKKLALLDRTAACIPPASVHNHHQSSRVCTSNLLFRCQGDKESIIPRKAIAC